MTLLSDQIRQAIAELKAELDEQLEEGLRVLLDLAGSGDEHADDLRSAFREIDAATSESEVLCRLLEQCSTKAERVGLLLVTKDAFEGWAGIGFDQSAFGDLRVEVDDVAATTLETAHDVAASAELKQALAKALPTAPALEAFTIPFVLRGNTEALLYADRTSSEAPLVIEDLRILCQLAAQTLELLTLRAETGNETSPIESSAAQETSPPNVELQPAAGETDPAFEPESADSSLDQQAALRATTEVWLPPTGGDDPGSAILDRDNVPDPAEDAVDEDALIGQAHDGIESVLDGASLGQEEGTARSDGEAALEREFGPTSAGTMPRAVERTAASPTEPTEPTEPTLEGHDYADAETGLPSEPEIEATEPSSPVTEIVLASENDELGPEAFAEDETPDLSAVVAPEDLSGPGSAFLTGSNETDADDDEDEQARRLAGFLISEIKLYNEDRLRDAAASGGVYAALEEDIELARGIYEDRTDAELRRSTSYFDDEVLRVLGDGDPSILGR